MATEKHLLGRIIHKHDIEENWDKATGFIPQQGEIIVYDIDDNYEYERFKIGDGVTTVTNLPFQKTNINDLKAVSYDIAQELTDEQKIQARANIGAGTPDSIKIIEATYYSNGESTISSTEEEINALIAEGKNVCIDCFIEPEDRTFRFYFSTKTSSGTTLFVNTEVSDGAPELKLLTLIGSTFMIITMPVPLRSLATESKDGLMSTEDKVKLDSIEEGAQVNVQSDWNQLDETQSDAILNKPFGEYKTVTELLAETEVTGTESDDAAYQYVFDANPFTGDEEKISVTFDGVEYVCNKIVPADGIYMFGNMSGDTGEPFIIEVNVSQNACVMILHDLNPHTISISEVNVNIKAIDPKYLPEGYPYEEVTAIKYDAFGEHNIPLALGQVWEVSYDTYGNRKYDTHEVQVSDDGTLYLGDLTLANKTPYYITATGCDYNLGWYRVMNITNAVVTCVSGTVTETIIHPIDEKFLPSSAMAQSDWSVNDENDPAYVKNRTHYDSREIVSTILEGTSADLPETSYELNKEYKVQFGDTEYTCEIQSFYLSPVACDMYYLGGNHWGGDGYSEYPFSIVIGKSTESIENIAATINVPEAPENPITVSILLDGELKQLEQKFVPNADWSQGYKDKAGYIENRTHYDDTINVVKHQEELNNLIRSVEKITSNSHVIEGITFRVIVDDVVYDNVPVYNGCNVAGGTTWGIGDLYVAGNWHTTDYGFCYSYNGLIDNPDIFPNYIKSIEVCTVEHNFKYLDHKYIKDMYYDNGSTTTVLVDNQTVTGFEVMEDPIYAVQNPFSFSPTVGATYTVTWDGTDYECTAATMSGMAYIGNVNYVNMQSGGDIPFAIVFTGAIFLATESTEESHTISITEVVHDMKQLDEKYLPILEEVNKTVFSMDGVINGNEFESSNGRLTGVCIVTVDGVSEDIEFINDIGYSWAEGSSYYIETLDYGIYFEFPDDEPHSVKIEIPQNVVKEEYLPETATPNWNAVKGENGYIENRTHYEDRVLVSTFDSSTDKMTPARYYESIDYLVVFDGVEYITRIQHKHHSTIGLYHSYLGSDAGDIGSVDADPPFSLYTHSSSGYPDLDAEEVELYFHYAGFEDGHTCEVYQYELKQLDQKFMPNADWSQHNSAGDGYIKNRTHYEDGNCVLRFTAVNNGSSYSYVSDYETLQPYIDLVNSGATTVYVKMNDVIVETTPGYYDIAFSLYYGEGFTTGNRLVVNYQGGTHGTTLIVDPKLVDPEYSADTVDICILTTSYYELKQIDEKFLPDSIVKNGDTELILTSSTAGSAKKFRITIDDNGVLTTKEVSE